MKADWVSLKLDSVRKKRWRRINRPDRNLKLNSILDGMLDFAKVFPGELVTETMLVQGINIDVQILKEMAEFLQVVEYKTVPTADGAYINLTDQELEQAKKQAETHLKGLQGEFRGEKIESKTHVIYGPVVEGIINIAAQEGVDLIALASHGRGGLARVFYGSVAAGLLHRVDRPLLIIRSRQTE